MISFLTDVGLAFWLGLLTPLTAVCVLPLYPGFLSFLASKLSGDSKKEMKVLGMLTVLGVISFMLIIGVVFSLILRKSLTQVIGIVSPIAFTILGLISILLIFDFDFSKYLPKAKTPFLKSPKLNAYVFGFFFGAIVIPCNPGFITAFFVRVVSITNFVQNMTNFLSFGIGIGFPLLVFSFLPSNTSSKVISFFTTHKSRINRIAGIIMLGIALYYLTFVFQVFS